MDGALVPGDILLFALIAGVLSFSLWRVLGARSTQDDDFESFSTSRSTKKDNVVSLPSRASSHKVSSESTRANETESVDPDWPFVAPENFPTILEVYRKSLTIDNRLDLKNFMAGAQSFFQTVSEVESREDLLQFKRYMTSAVFEALANTLTWFHNQNITFKAKEAGLVNFSLEAPFADITVVFKIEEHSSEAPAQLTSQTWVFRRNLEVQDPNWLLHSVHTPYA